MGIIKSGFETVGTVLGGAWDTGTKLFSGDFSGAWETVKDTGASLVGDFVSAPVSILDPLDLTGLRGTVKDGVKDGIKGGIGTIEEGVGNLFGSGSGSDLEFNEAKAAEATAMLDKICTSTIVEAENEIKAAVEKLNKVKGFSEYVGAVSFGKFEADFDTMISAVQEIKSTLESNIQAVKAYAESDSYSGWDFIRDAATSILLPGGVGLSLVGTNHIIGAFKSLFTSDGKVEGMEPGSGKSVAFGSLADSFGAAKGGTPTTKPSVSIFTPTKTPTKTSGGGGGATQPLYGPPQPTSGGGGYYGGTPTATPFTPTTPTPTQPKTPAPSATPTKTPPKTPPKTPTTTPVPTVTPQPTPPAQPTATPAQPQPTPMQPQQPSHQGGGYSSQGYVADTAAPAEPSQPTPPIKDSGLSSIDNIVKGGTKTKIPVNSTPITKTSSGSGASAVIPIAAGLSAAAAAGIGAKVYMDRKKNNETGEDDDWSTSDDSIDVEYNESSDGQYLEDDDYSYNESKYDARSNQELADLQ